MNYCWTGHWGPLAGGKWVPATATECQVQGDHSHVMQSLGRPRRMPVLGFWQRGDEPSVLDVTARLSHKRPPSRGDKSVDLASFLFPPPVVIHHDRTSVNKMPLFRVLVSGAHIQTYLSWHLLLAHSKAVLPVYRAPSVASPFRQTLSLSLIA